LKGVPGYSYPGFFYAARHDSYAMTCMNIETVYKKQLLGNPLPVAEVSYKYEQFNGSMSGETKKVIVNRRDAVAAIVYHTGTRQYLFARQFRYAARGKETGWLTELMAGVIDEGETEVQALAREMQEELGYTPLETEKIAAFFTAPGYSTEQVHLYYVEVDDNTKTSQGGGLAEENEDIQTISYTLSEIKTMVNSAALHDAKTLIGCHYILNKRTT